VGLGCVWFFFFFLLCPHDLDLRFAVSSLSPPDPPDFFPGLLFFLGSVGCGATLAQNSLRGSKLAAGPLVPTLIYAPMTLVEFHLNERNLVIVFPQLSALMATFFSPAVTLLLFFFSR